MSKKKNKNELESHEFDRRELILKTLLGSGGLCLKSLLTGLPISFLTHRAMAAGNGNLLVYSSSNSGDPFNCNVPGTYVPGYAHPPAYSSPQKLTIGSSSIDAAPVWNSLNSEILKSSNFFHLQTNTNSHNEMENVLKIFGSIKPISGRSPEMLPSIIAHEVGKMRGTLLNQPIGLGSMLSYKGQRQKIYNPTEIKSLFASGVEVKKATSRKFRDTQLDMVYKEIKKNGTPAQKKFLDQKVISSKNSQELGGQLAAAMTDINGSSDVDRMKTAAALLALNVTAAVTVRIRFGGDNHKDSGLARETSEHASGVSTINALYDALKSYNLHTQTNFALLNVFGRKTYLNSTGGRDHHGKHTVMYSFGPGIKGGMTGNIKLGKKNYESQAINSTTGLTTAPDIDANKTLHSAGKSLLAASGIATSKIDDLITDGKIVKSFVK